MTMLVEERRHGLARALVFLVVSMAVGIAAASVARLFDTGWLLTGLTALVLCMPALVAAARLRESSRAVVPFVVGLGLAFFFVPRLVTFDPTSGLVAKAFLMPDEIESSKMVAEAALIAFALPVALLFRYTPIPRPQAEEAQQDSLRPTLHVRTAFVLGAAGSLAALAIGLTMGTSSRTFESAGDASPLGFLEFFAITAPAALWLGGRRRLSMIMLALSVAGPYFKGGRQDVLTPLLILLIVVVATRRRRNDGRRDISVKAIALVVVIVLGALGVAVATTARRDSQTVESGENSPTVLSSLVEDQTLFDSLLVAVARERRPQGLEIYGRVLAAPIPRALWPDKPFSYDYDFRQRHFPAFEDAIPISLVGTSFVSFLVPGAVLAGLVVALLALYAETLLSRNGLRNILIGAVMAIFILDLIRIGGVYRESLTFVGSVLGVVFITRAAPVDDLEGAAKHVEVS